MEFLPKIISTFFAFLINTYGEIGFFCVISIIFFSLFIFYEFIKGGW